MRKFGEEKGLPQMGMHAIIGIAINFADDPSALFTGEIRMKKKALLAGAGLVLVLSMFGCAGVREMAENVGMAFSETVEKAPHLFSSGGRELKRQIEELESASVPEEMPGHQEYYFHQADEQEKRIYRQIQSGIEEFETDILLTTADDDLIDRAYQKVLMDHPEYFWAQNAGNTRKILYTTYARLQPGYNISASEARSQTEQIEKLADEILAEVDQKENTYLTARLIYEHIITDTEYVQNENDQNIAGVFLQNEAVCAGYARAFQYLCEKAGIECIYVTGDARDTVEGHAWNMIKLDGEYYYVDVTYGDMPEFSSSLEENQVLYDYFCPFPEEYEQLVTPDAGLVLPSCTATANNYYVRNASCFEEFDRTEVYNYFVYQIDEKNRVIHFKYTNREAYERAKTELRDNGLLDELAGYFMDYYGLDTLNYRYGTLDELYTFYVGMP